MLDRIGAFISDFFWKFASFLKPDPIVWKGAGLGLGGMVIILLVLMASLMFNSLGIMGVVIIDNIGFWKDLVNATF